MNSEDKVKYFVESKPYFLKTGKHSVSFKVKMNTVGNIAFTSLLNMWIKVCGPIIAGFKAGIQDHG
jgi:hypothetical protein